MVRTIYKALEDRDFGPVREVIDAAVEFVNPPTAVEQGTRYGRAAFEAAMLNPREVFDYSNKDIERIEAAGPRVLAVINTHGRSRTAGVPFEISHYHVYTFRRGRLVRFEWFFDLTDALAVVGLRE